METNETLPAVAVERKGAVLVPSGDLLPDENQYAVMWRMAEAFVQSGLMPDGVKTPAAALLMIQKGRELGIPPSYACSNIHVIKGKPTCSAELMMALILSRVGPDAMIVEETTPERCEVSYARPGWDKRRHFAWTIAQARAAQLLSNPMWAKYPDAMLRARCISAAARLAFPDIIGGMYTPEELGAPVNVTPMGAVEIEAAALPASTQPAAATAPPPPVSERTMKRLHARGREFGFTPEDLHDLAAWEFGVESKSDMHEEQAAFLADNIHERGGLVAAIIEAAGRVGMSREKVWSYAKVDALGYLSVERLTKLRAWAEGLPAKTAPAAPAPSPLDALIATAAAHGLDDSALLNIAGPMYGVESLDALEPGSIAGLEAHVRENYEVRG